MFDAMTLQAEASRHPGAYLLEDDEAIVDLFAGGGGASEGIFQALGRHPDVAINHDADALAVHARNHPETVHYCEDIWKARPRDVLKGRRLGMLWLSPSCTHFSRAAGGVPKSKQLRSLPGVALTWAKYAHPKIIICENVSEMEDWSPLLDDGTPCPKRKGLSFRIWVGRLRGLGYKVEWRERRAADYGDPTIRTRLFIIARCDGGDIVWPQPTHHAKPSLFEKPWRTAAECIDWSIPCPSIFDRQRPIVDNTLTRIAEGIHRHVLGVKDPFLVEVAVPHISSFYGTNRGSPVTDPLGSVTAQGNHQALVTAHIHNFYGKSASSPVTDPLGTVTTKASHHGLVSALLAPITHTGPRRGSGMNEPIPTLTCANRGEQAIISAVLAGCGGRAGQSAPKPMTEPVNTITAKADQVLVAAFMAQHNTGNAGHDMREPLSTIMGGGHHQQVVQATLSADDEVRAERVSAFLLQYYSSGKRSQSLRDPLGAITTKGRFALVMVKGVATPIVDISMRMLQVHELKAAQGFPLHYDLTDGGRLSKTTQIRLIGNSVCPGMAKAIVQANVRRAPTPSYERFAA